MFSIVIPVYNEERFILQVLKNVNSNTWFLNGDFWNDSSATGYWISGHVDAGATVTGLVLRNNSGNFDAGTYKIIQYNTI